MKGNMLGFVTAVLTFAAVAWQGYEEYLRRHLATPPAAKTTAPVYWHDGRHWFCRVGQQEYIWLPDSERLAGQQPTIR
jgi:hypothetical protein